MIIKNTLKQFAALMVISGAASAALPPVVDGRGHVAAPQISASSMLGMYNRLDQLQQEVQQLLGQIEEQDYLIETLKKRQRDLYLDVDRRIVQLESGENTLPVTGGVIPELSSQTEQAQNPQPSVLGDQDKLAYNKAFSSLKAGRYKQSIVDFTKFEAEFPNSAYIPNALYWLGEASYVNRDFKRALDEFNKVVTQYGDHPKAKDAMLKVGFIQYEDKQWKQARATLEKVTASYPGTTVASLAEKRLDRMRQEKH